MINRKQLSILFVLLLIAISVRVLTLQFMRTHLHDAAWFQVGSYLKFHRQASNILDGRQRLFWIDDPARTDLPLVVIGLIALIRRREWQTLAILLTVPAYYLIVQSTLHTERRYVYIIQFFFLILAAATLWHLFNLVRSAILRK